MVEAAVDQAGGGADGATPTALELKGGCFCGACRVEINAPGGKPMFTALCHCTICQRLSGAPYVHYVGFETAELVCVKGQDKLVAIKSSESMCRYSCSVCSSPVFSESLIENFEFRDLPAGILDRDEQGKIIDYAKVEPVGHIFYGSAVRPVVDGLPKFTEYPGSDTLPEVPP